MEGHSSTMFKDIISRLAAWTCPGDRTLWWVKAFRYTSACHYGRTGQGQYIYIVFYIIYHILICFFLLRSRNCVDAILIAAVSPQLPDCSLRMNENEPLWITVIGLVQWSPLHCCRNLMEQNVLCDKFNQITWSHKTTTVTRKQEKLLNKKYI